MNRTTHSPVGWILYDDTCGICRRWVPFWEKALLKRGFEIAPLQADWVRNNLNLDDAELLKDLRLLLADGQQVQGAEVYRYAMRRIWWAYPIFVLSVLPGFRWIFDRCYRSVADNRYRISEACRIPPRGNPF